MLGVIYARYSSDNQRDESIDGQLRVCKEYAERNGIQLVGEYIDRAISGRKDNRPDFQRMIHDSKKKLFDVVLVWKFDRFSRDRFDAAIYKKKLKNNGVKVVSVTEFIPDSPFGAAIEAIIEADAEIYVKNLSENVIRGMTENALKGRYNGSAIPLGYKIDENKLFQIDPCVAPFVVEAFEQYANGKRMKEIVTFLNDKGVRTAFGGEITINVVTNMLHNRRYIGEYRYRDIVLPEGIPPIITKELFERVQQRMAKTKKAPAQHKAEDDYILTTKLFCGKCNAMMVGESGTSRANKEVHHYYKCVSVKKRRGCDKKTVRKDWIEGIVLNEIKKFLFDDEMIEAVAEEMVRVFSKENNEVPLLEKSLTQVGKKIENMLHAIEEGIFTVSTKEHLEMLEERKEELKRQITEKQLARPVFGKEQFAGWIAHFRSFDFDDKEQRRQLVDQFVNSIYLYDDHFDLFFHFGYDAKNLTFDESQLADARKYKKRNSSLESSDMSALGLPVWVLITKVIDTHFLFSRTAASGVCSMLSSICNKIVKCLDMRPLGRYNTMCPSGHKNARRKKWKARPRKKFWTRRSSVLPRTVTKERICVILPQGWNSASPRCTGIMQAKRTSGMPSLTKWKLITFPDSVLLKKCLLRRSPVRN